MYFAATRLLAHLYRKDNPAAFVWPAFLAAGLLAFCAPFWLHALVAEVYTLHAFFICVLIVLLLLWREKDDVRYLYGAALLYGLSAGNHATVAFLLPAILVVFFAWCRKDTGRHLAACTAFFLIGLSVYSYLPVRSMTEPSLDWGNPETVERFLYQVTDRKDAGTHFSVLRSSAGAEDAGLIGAAGAAWNAAARVLRSFCSDIGQNLTWIALFGFFAGIYFILRRNPALTAFFLLIVAVNATFFAHWREESFIPSYIVVCLFTAVALYAVFFRKLDADAEQLGRHPAILATQKAFTQMDWPKAIVPALVCVIGWNAFTGYPRVDRSDLYFGETWLKRVFLSLENRSVFVTGNSWFDYFYNQDVARLRDDVTAVKAWDFLDTEPPAILTARRYPDLDLPDATAHSFQSREGAQRYLNAFIDANKDRRPILMDQNITFFEQLPMEPRFEPYKNILLKFDNGAKAKPEAGLAAFEQFKALMTGELKKPGIERTEWITKISFYIPSFARYFHATQRYSEERAVLKLMHDFLGHQGLTWLFQMTDNLILDGQTVLAEAHLEMMRERFPDHYETHLAQGLFHLALKEYEQSIRALKTAAAKNPSGFRPYLELARAYHELGERERAQEERARAQQRIRTLGDLEKVRGLPVG